MTVYWCYTVSHHDSAVMLPCITPLGCSRVTLYHTIYSIVLLSRITPEQCSRVTLYIIPPWQHRRDDCKTSVLPCKVLGHSRSMNFPLCSYEWRLAASTRRPELLTLCISRRQNCSYPARTLAHTDAVTWVTSDTHVQWHTVLHIWCWRFILLYTLPYLHTVYISDVGFYQCLLHCTI